MGFSVEKWLVMGCLALVSALLGFAPYFILKKVKAWGNILNNKGYHQTLPVLSCMGGGVLLATALTHMLPENRESLAAVPYVQDNLDHFPLAEVLTLAGFALIYLVEEIAHFIMSGSHLGHGHSHGAPPNHHFKRDTIARHSSMVHGIPGPIPGGPRASFLNTSSSRSNSCVEIKITPPTDWDSKIELTSLQSIVTEDSDLGSQLRSFLALIALSFHAIMEGIAIGIQVRTIFYL